jgi:hypothetical protein
MPVVLRSRLTLGHENDRIAVLARDDRPRGVLVTGERVALQAEGRDRPKRVDSRRMQHVQRAHGTGRRECRLRKLFH